MTKTGIPETDLVFKRTGEVFPCLPYSVGGIDSVTLRQYGKSYQSSAVSKDEFPPDRLEQRGSRKAVRAENLLEERWKNY